MFHPKRYNDDVEFNSNVCAVEHSFRSHFFFAAVEIFIY